MTITLTATMFNRTITTKHATIAEARTRILDIATAQACALEGSELEGKFIPQTRRLGTEGTYLIEGEETPGIDPNFTLHTVVVYLNDSRDAAFGFDNEFSAPELRRAHEFTMRAWHRDDAETLLHVIYEQLNIGGSPMLEARPYTVEYRAAGNRSLSVGDVVELDGQLYAVGSYGFEPVTDQALQAALVTPAR